MMSRALTQIFRSSVVLLAASAFAEDKSSQPAPAGVLTEQPGEKQWKMSEPPPAARTSAEERWKAWIERIPPAKRRKFLENMERWEKLPTEARERIRERFRQMHQRAKRDAEEAYREMGLELSSEQRAVFIQRYLEERRYIEEKLRREMEAKRKDEVTSLKKRLRQEFGGGTPAVGAPRDAVPRERPGGQVDEGRPKRPENQSPLPSLPEK